MARLGRLNQVVSDYLIVVRHMLLVCPGDFRRG